ncbi:MAG: hypothetical protein L0215_07355 [Gemmataceae bacterium]|nr:hypothetical protein [Gemmataceae bacterium]
MTRLALRSHRAQSPRYRPHLEGLESRDCPNAAPTIFMGIMSVQQKNVVLSGVVQDESPAGLTVQFSGQYTGTTQTDSEGTFTVSVTPAQLGAIFAGTTDNIGQASNVAQVNVTSNAPAIVNFAATRLAGNIFTFTGRVVDEDPLGLKVTFGGLPSLVGRYVLAGADGSFSLTVELACGEEGIATAQTTDWWLLNSAIAETLVCNGHSSLPGQGG